jgi:hypothetical protein
VKKVLVVGLLLVMAGSLGVLAFGKKFVVSTDGFFPGPLGSVPNGGIIKDITWGRGRSANIIMWSNEDWAYKTEYIVFRESEEGPEDIGLGMADQWAPI